MTMERWSKLLFACLGTALLLLLVSSQTNPTLTAHAFETVLTRSHRLAPWLRDHGRVMLALLGN
jgi:hypothetical protein